MILDLALKTPGWMDAAELEYIARVASRSYVAVELGSWRGRSAIAWAQNLLPGGVVYCVDTWANDAYGATFPGDPPDLHRAPEWLLTEFLRNTHGLNNIIPVRTQTGTGASILSRIGIRPDVVFIDAGHNYSDVVGDIQACIPLLSEGGVLCGHDYNEVHHLEVIRAVRDCLPHARVVPGTTIWTTEKE